MKELDLGNRPRNAKHVYCQLCTPFNLVSTGIYSEQLNPRHSTPCQQPFEKSAGPEVLS